MTATWLVTPLRRLKGPLQGCMVHVSFPCSYSKHQRTQSSPKACNSAAHSHDSYRRRCVYVFSALNEPTSLALLCAEKKLTRTQNLRYAPLHLCVYIKTVACVRLLRMPLPPFLGAGRAGTGDLQIFDTSDGSCDYLPRSDQTQTSARPTQIGKFSVAHGCGIHWRPTLDRARDRDVSRWARAHAKLSLS